MQLANSLLAYLPAAVIVTLLPGPDTALVLGVATRHGVATAWRAAFGVGSGLMVWAVAVSAGLASALRAAANSYAAFRWCCAAYLLYLAISAVLATWRRAIVDHLVLCGRHRLCVLVSGANLPNVCDLGLARCSA